MKFLADENLERTIVDHLRQHGFDVRYIAEEVPSADDNQILDWANREGRILTTNDKDFGEMAFRGSRVHTGIVLLRFRREDAMWKAQRLMQFLQQYSKPLSGKFIVLQDAGVRIRSLLR